LKQHIAELIQVALKTLIQEGKLPGEAPTGIQIERSRDPQHGDFASNIALTLARVARRRPRSIATDIVAALPRSESISRVEIAGPGFINFFVSSQARLQTVMDILRLGPGYGRSRIGAGQRIQVEFVSANPTGPLHIGHGRGAAYGAALANLLETTGFEVEREYYVNDAGRQMDILALSVWLRYLECCGETPSFPDNAYRGDYVQDIAASLYAEHGERYRVSANELQRDLPPDVDADVILDALIARARALLGEEDYAEVHAWGLNDILAGIRDDLRHFGVEFQCWFSERSLADGGHIDQALGVLKQAGHLYEQGGAIWFRSTAFGDEKDRVVVRENGQKTYFASDIAYHMNKFERGFDRVINVWGADHHGYVPRVRAALTALGRDAECLEILLVQFASLYRGQEKVQMSTRSGQFVTLRELCDEVGRDAARLFYVQRRCEQHLDFDLELAKSESSDNPVYYIQYAHARICSVLRQLSEKGLDWSPEDGQAHLDRLQDAHEQALLTRLSTYPEMIEAAALNREPHQLAHYLRDLANDFHTYYNARQFLVEDVALRNARLNLIAATRQVLANGLGLLDVSAPEQM